MEKELTKEILDLVNHQGYLNAKGKDRLIKMLQEGGN